MRKAAAMLTVSAMLTGAFASLFSIASEHSFAALPPQVPECHDGIDNDGNGLTDYPQDPGCSSITDDYEGISSSGNFISITDDRETVSPGGNLVYAITLKQQRDTARDVDVVVELPAQTSVISASDGGSYTPGFVRWTNVSVYKNVTRTLTLNINVSPDVRSGQYLVARAKVTGASATDTTLVTDFIAPLTDLFTVKVSDGQENVLPGSNVTYVVRARNTANFAQTVDVNMALPYQLDYISTSDGGQRNSYSIVWRQINFQPNEERTFSVTAQVDPATPDRYLLRTKAYVGPVIDVDSTVVRVSGLPDGAIDTYITDNRDNASRGDLLTYEVSVHNHSSVVATNVSVDAALPLYGEFVSATEGGTWDGSNVRWLILVVAPNDTRHLEYTVRVRSDAPDGASLLGSVRADGSTSSDKTLVGPGVSYIPSPNYGNNQVLFRKTSDRAEAMPGTRIRYTLFVRNVLDHAITDAVITDRFDGDYLNFVNAENPQDLLSQNGNVMQWQVPVLQPGESWQTSYILQVSANTPAGLELANVASIRGSDLDGVSLTETVKTNEAGVMRDIPHTGAEMDVLVAFVLAAFALIPAGLNRKFSFGI